MIQWGGRSIFKFCILADLVDASAAIDVQSPHSVSLMQQEYFRENSFNCRSVKGDVNKTGTQNVLRL